MSSKAKDTREDELRSLMRQVVIEFEDYIDNLRPATSSMLANAIANKEDIDDFLKELKEHIPETLFRKIQLLFNRDLSEYPELQEELLRVIKNSMKNKPTIVAVGKVVEGLDENVKRHIERVYHEAYDPTDVKLAFIYKLKERDEIQNRLLEGFITEASDYKAYFLREINKILALKSKSNDSIMREISNFFSDEEQRRESTDAYHLAKFAKIKDKIFKIIADVKLPSEQLRLIEAEINNVIEDVNYKKTIDAMSKQWASQSYFKKYFLTNSLDQENFRKLYKTGKLYCPPDENHKWILNLAWLLGHFHKGSEFVIMSEVSLDQLKRRKFEGMSGFAREIAICYKLGYKFEQREKDVILRHPWPDMEEMKKITLDDINISEEEMMKLYQLAVADYEKIKKQSPVEDSKEQSESTENTTSLSSSARASISNLSSTATSFSSVTSSASSGSTARSSDLLFRGLQGEKKRKRSGDEASPQAQSPGDPEEDDFGPKPPG